jgi:hypothetical protein
MTTTLTARPAPKGAGVTLVPLPDRRDSRRWWWLAVPAVLLVAVAAVVAVTAGGDGGEATDVPVTAPAATPAPLPDPTEPPPTEPPPTAAPSTPPPTEPPTTAALTTAPAPIDASATKSATLVGIAGANCPDFAQRGIPTQGTFPFTLNRTGDVWTMTNRLGQVATADNATGVDVVLVFEPRVTEPVPGLQVTQQMTETMTFVGTTITGTNVTRYTFVGAAGGFDYTDVECIATFALEGTATVALA